MVKSYARYSLIGEESDHGLIPHPGILRAKLNTKP